jgi:uncharacterized protein (DUF486 family)
MTFAWYGGLRLKWLKDMQASSLVAAIFLSWGIALFEYIFMVPANRSGYIENGGTFSLMELKTLQEAISLSVFLFINLYIFKAESPQWNHLVGFALIILAVYIIFKKW